MSKKMKIYILGTIHISSKSKDKIRHVVETSDFDKVLSEGISTDRKAYTWKNFLKEPFFIIAVIFYKYFLKLFGTDFMELKRVSKKENLKVTLIDINFSDAIEYGHREYNYLIFVILFMFIFTFSFVSQYLFRVTLSFILSEIIYLGYFVTIPLNKAREYVWIRNIKSLLEGRDYNKVLLVMGKGHVKRIREYLIKEGIDVKLVN